VDLQNGEWPIIEDNENDPEWEATVTRNRKSLVALLQRTGENTVELYGVWDGDFDKEPKVRESLSVERILDPNFWFKEQGFYVVEI
jgi:hypothetical protein